MWDRKELKQRGMAAFKANYWKTVLVCFLLSFFVLGGMASGSGVRRTVKTGGSGSEAIGELAESLQNGGVTVNGQTFHSVEEALDRLDDLGDLDDLDDLNNLGGEISAAMQNFVNSSEGKTALAIAGAVIAAAVLIGFTVGLCLRVFLFNPLGVGCQRFLLKNAVGQGELGELAYGFTPDYWRSVKTLFLLDLYLALWTLLLIVPGIVKRYAYRMTPYILADNPELSGKEAITLSRQMMDGQKWDAFVLDLSFIGWNILSALTLGVLGIFYVNPYRYCTNAELYRELKRR